MANQATNTEKKKSKYNGVFWYPQTKKWRALLKLPNGKLRHIGYYKKEINAARAYDLVVREILEDDEDYQLNFSDYSDSENECMSTDECF